MKSSENFTFQQGSRIDAIDAIMMQLCESLRPAVEEKLSAIYPP